MSREFTRRELAALLGVGAIVARSTPSLAASLKRARGLVGVAEIDERGAAQPQACLRAVSGALRAAVPGAETAEDAVASLFSAGDTVGIKLNCLAGKRLSPRRGLVEALVQVIADAGVPRHRIIVFERSSRELERAGFTVRRSGGGYLCYGTDNDYDRQPSVSGQIGSCFARLVSTTCTALVSFGVVKDHDLSGVSAGLKNWYGVIHNPNKYHDNNCDPYLADVVNHPFLRSKIRLTVLDGVSAQCDGGPAFHGSGVFPLGRVAVSVDQLAADLWAWKVIDKERRRRGLPTLDAAGRAPKYIRTAATYGLGTGDLESLREAMA